MEIFYVYRNILYGIVRRRKEIRMSKIKGSHGEESAKDNKTVLQQASRFVKQECVKKKSYFDLIIYFYSNHRT